VGDVEVGVEAQLAQPRARAGDALQQLVAQRLEGRVHGLVGAEQLLLAVLPLRGEGGARLLGERRGRLQRASVAARGEREHQPLARPRHRHVQQASHLGHVRGARVGRELLVQQRVGDRLDRLTPGARHARGLQPQHVHVPERQARRGVHRHDRDRARAGLRPAFLVAQAGLRDRRDRARELARRGLRRATDVRGGELAQLGEAHEPLHDVGLCREQLLAAEAEPVDEAVHEQVGARRVERGRGGAVELQEPEDPLARLGRQLRRLGGGHERGDHVELAPARDLHAASEVDRAQLDRRARQRADHGARVRGVDEQAQPGQDVLDLGALEERRRARQPVRHGALLERERDGLALVAHRAHEDRDLLRRHPGPDQAPDVGRDRLRLRALVRRPPEAHRPARRRLEALVDPLGHRRDDRPGGGDHALRAAQRLLEAHRAQPRQLGRDVLEVLRRCRARAPDRLVVVAGRRQRRPAALAAEQEHEAQRGMLEILGVVEQQVPVARGHARANVRAVAEQGDRVQHEVAEVERALAGEQPVVGLVHRGELALALGAVVAGGQRRGPA
jgi:hypothetical protein